MKLINTSYDFQAALMWSKKYCDTNQNMNLKEVIGNFLEYIQFHKIPANVLMREVHPLGLVPYSIIMNALAYQVLLRNIFKYLLKIGLMCLPWQDRA